MYIHFIGIFTFWGHTFLRLGLGLDLGFLYDSFLVVSSSIFFGRIWQLL